MSTIKWTKILAPFSWKLVIFDCCLMSTLETCYQLAHVTPFVLACETYMPYIGCFSADMVRAFDSSYSSDSFNSIGKDDDVERIGKRIIDSFIFRVNTFVPGPKEYPGDPTQVVPDPADICLVSTKYLPALVKELRRLGPLVKTGGDM